METPCINIELNKESIIFINEFNLEFESLKYLVKFGKSSNNEELIIYIKEEEKISTGYYQAFFTLQQLQKKNKYFRVFDTIDETINYFENIISEKKLFIKKINDILSVTFKINNLLKDEEEVNLELKKSKLGTEKIIDNLISQINNINLEISIFKNEISTLKNENKSLNLEISALKNEITNLKNENKSLKDENKILTKKIDEILEQSYPIEKFDSLIIKTNKELEMISKRIQNIDILKRKKIKYQLIYRGSRDGMNPSYFHQKADGISPTISIIETIKGFKFGGYTEKTWENSICIAIKDDKSFVFSLDYMKIYNHIKGADAILHCKTSGPTFYYCFNSNGNFNENSNYTSKLSSVNTYFSGFSKDYELNNGEKNFTIKEIEVFKVLFE